MEQGIGEGRVRVTARISGRVRLTAALCIVRPGAMPAKRDHKSAQEALDD